MKSEKLYEGITEIRNETIRRAENVRFRAGGKRLLRWGSLAAASALILGLGFFFAIALRPAGSSGSGGAFSGGMAGSTGSSTGGILPVPGDTSGSTGSGAATPGNLSNDGVSRFQSYAGPVLALTALEDAPDITVSRNTVFDFSPYALRTVTDTDGTRFTRSERAAEVTDSYTLRNSGEADETLTLLYPFIGSFDSAPDILPAVTVNGTSAAAELLAGGYAGSFFDSTGKPSESERLNLLEPTNWEKYRDLLADGSYLNEARNALPEMTGDVILYTFTDFTAPKRTDSIPNATLQVSFEQDYDETILLTSGFNGGEMDKEAGSGSRIVSGLGNEKHTEKACLILLSGDIRNVTLQGYGNAGCHPGEEIEVTCRMERTVVPAEEFLRELTAEYLAEQRDGSPRLLDSAEFELLYRAFRLMLSEYGLNRPYQEKAERYDFGRLEELFADTMNVRRVFWLRVNVTVPTGGEVTVEAQMKKEASVNHFGDTLTQGFDLMSAGSRLHFTQQTAEVRSVHLITMEANTFGFDLPNGTFAVGLTAADTPAEEHWQMLVTKKE